jgi:hypothetical protein
LRVLLTDLKIADLKIINFKIADLKIINLKQNNRKSLLYDENNFCKFSCLVAKRFKLNKKADF